MKLEIERYRILIVPETPQDEAMLEEVFGLREDGDIAVLIRRNATNLGCWAFAEVLPKKRSKP